MPNNPEKGPFFSSFIDAPSYQYVWKQGEKIGKRGRSEPWCPDEPCVLRNGSPGQGPSVRLLRRGGVGGAPPHRHPPRVATGWCVGLGITPGSTHILRRLVQTTKGLQSMPAPPWLTLSIVVYTMLRDSDTNRKAAKRFRTQADTYIDDGRQTGRTQLARLGDNPRTFLLFLFFVVV